MYFCAEVPRLLVSNYRHYEQVFRIFAWDYYASLTVAFVVGMQALQWEKQP